jgi:DNA-directed RNA polymerase specialized sigma24 family protein
VAEPVADDRFLALLDPDPRQAEEKLVKLRTKLVFYFRQSGCTDSENLADEVLFRAVRRISEGVTCDAGLNAYCYGIAGYVLQEERRRVKPEALPDEIKLAERPPPRSLSRSERKILLEECLQCLPPDEADILRRYYQEDRVKLAASLGWTSNSLRIRVCRILHKVTREVPGGARAKGVGV